jgi:hypothetical protein
MVSSDFGKAGRQPPADGRLRVNGRRGAGGQHAGDAGILDEGTTIHPGGIFLFPRERMAFSQGELLQCEMPCPADSGRGDAFAPGLPRRLAHDHETFERFSRHDRRTRKSTKAISGPLPGTAH